MPTSSRYFHLDALRSFAMIFGVLVHTTTIGTPPGLDWIATVSGFFRMAAFFVVSGFLAAMMLTRISAGEFVRRRALALLVPFATGVILLNPITNYLIYTYHNTPIPIIDYFSLAEVGPAARGPMVWHLHLWFLLALFFYVATAPAVLAVTRRIPAVSALFARVVGAASGWLVVPVVALVLSVAVVAARVVYELGLARILDDTPAAWLVQTTLHYWPYFLTGMAIFHVPAFRERFQSLSIPALAIGALMLIAVHQGLQGRDGDLVEVATIASKAFLTTTIVALLLTVFERTCKTDNAFIKLSDYIYSIYIFHFLFIYIIAHILRPIGLNQYLFFFAVAAIAYAATYLVHKYCVRPSPIMKFLFNGKPLPSLGRALKVDLPAPVAAGHPGRLDSPADASAPRPRDGA